MLSNVFAVMLSCPDAYKKGIYIGGEQRRKRPSSDEDSRFIDLPFPFLSKLKIWSFYVAVLQGRQRNKQ